MDLSQGTYICYQATAPFNTTLCSFSCLRLYGKVKSDLQHLRMSACLKEGKKHVLHGVKRAVLFYSLDKRHVAQRDRTIVPYIDRSRANSSREAIGAIADSPVSAHKWSLGRSLSLFFSIFSNFGSFLGPR